MSSEPQLPDLSELFSERSLWEIFRKSPPFYRNFFNLLTVLAALLCLTAFVVTRVVCGAESLEFHKIFFDWANAGIVITSTILGFLLAGFAVLFTLLRPETILRLQQVKRAGEQLSELKLIFFVFIDVFVHYLAFLFWCVLVLIFGGDNGPAHFAMRVLEVALPGTTVAVSSTIFVLWGTWFVLLILKLKSFVYNLYQALLLGVADSISQ